MNEPSNIKHYKEVLSEQIMTFLCFIDDIRAPFRQFIRNEDKLVLITNHVISCISQFTAPVIFVLQKLADYRIPT